MVQKRNLSETLPSGILKWSSCVPRGTSTLILTHFYLHKDWVPGWSLKSKETIQPTLLFFHHQYRYYHYKISAAYNSTLFSSYWMSNVHVLLLLLHLLFVKQYIHVKKQEKLFGPFQWRLTKPSDLMCWSSVKQILCFSIKGILDDNLVEASF